MYARLMRERFGASDASCRLRFHTQTGGVTLTAQQPLNNVVRVTMQALAATLGGTQSLHTNGYDEALSLPDREAATLALRTQQIVAYESGVANTVDPLAGSYYVESLTDELERRRSALIDRIEEIGRRREGDRSRRSSRKRSRAARTRTRCAWRAGETVIVGVNRFAGRRPKRLTCRAPDYTRSKRTRSRDSRRVEPERDAAAVAAIAGDACARARVPIEMTPTAGDRPSLMPVIIDAVRARATVGEIADTLREEWGAFAGA